MVPGLLRDPVAPLVGDWDWLGGPGLPHAYAQVADACMEGFPKELTSLRPTLVVGFSFSTDWIDVYKLQNPLSAFIIGAGGGLVVSGLLQGEILIALTGILWVFVGCVIWRR